MRQKLIMWLSHGGIQMKKNAVEMNLVIFVVITNPNYNILVNQL